MPAPFPAFRLSPPSSTDKRQTLTDTEGAIENVQIKRVSVLGGLDLEKCKGFPSPGTKETIRVIMKSPYYAGVRTAGFDYIY